MCIWMVSIVESVVISRIICTEIERKILILLIFVSVINVQSIKIYNEEQIVNSETNNIVFTAKNGLSLVFR